jgi:glutaredoxin
VIAITLYSRPGCHLCDEMKALVSGVVGRRPDVSVTEVDISSDPALEARYGMEIPVLLIDGKKVAKYRVEERALRTLLAERAARAGKTE